VNDVQYRDHTEPLAASVHMYMLSATERDEIYAVVEQTVTQH